MLPEELDELVARGTFTVETPGTAVVSLTVTQVNSIAHVSDNTIYFYAGLDNAAGAVENDAVPVRLPSTEFSVDRQRITDGELADGVNLQLRVFPEDSWPIDSTIWWGVSPTPFLTEAQLGTLPTVGTVKVVEEGQAIVAITDVLAAQIGDISDGRIFIYAGLADAAGAAQNLFEVVTVTFPAYTVSPRVFAAGNGEYYRVNFTLTQREGPAWEVGATIWWAITPYDHFDGEDLKNIWIRKGLAIVETPGEVYLDTSKYSAYELSDVWIQTYVYAGIDTAENAAAYPPAAVAMTAPAFEADPSQLTQAHYRNGFTVTLTVVQRETWAVGTRLFWAASAQRTLAAPELEAQPVKGIVVVTEAQKATITLTKEDVDAVGPLTRWGLYLFAGRVSAAGAVENAPVAIEIISPSFSPSPRKFTRDELVAGIDFTLTHVSRNYWKHPSSITWAVSANPALDEESYAQQSVRSTTSTKTDFAIEFSLYYYSISGIYPLTDNRFYLYADVSAEVAMANGPETIIVTTPQFTVSPLSVTDAQYAAGFELTLTETPGDTWAVGSKIFWCISRHANLEASGMDALEAKGIITVTTAKTATLAITSEIAAKIESLTGGIFYLYAGLGSSRMADGCTPVALTVRPCAISLYPGWIIDSNLAAGLEFNISVQSGTSWPVGATVFWAVAASPTLSAAQLAALEAKGEFTVESEDLATANLTSEMSATIGPLTDRKLYVYAGLNDAATAALDSPYMVTVGPDPPSFTVAPLEMPLLRPMTTPLLTLSPKGIEWPTSAEPEFKARFTLNRYSSEYVEIPITVAASGDTTTYTIPKDSDLSAIIGPYHSPPALFVDVKLAEDTYMNEYVEILLTNTGGGGGDDDTGPGVSPLLSLCSILALLFIMLL